MQWEEIKFQIEEKFGIDNCRTEEEEIDRTSDGEVIKAKKEIIEFTGPLGKIKVERITKPRVIDKKTLYTRRIGGKVAVDYVYSDEETVSQIKFYKKNESGEWQEIDATMIPRL